MSDIIRLPPLISSWQCISSPGFSPGIRPMSRAPNARA